MSKFSGKCDLYDWFDGRDKDLSKVRIYLGNSIIPLNIKTKKDLIPLYPYIVAIGYHTNDDDGCDVIHLSTESFVDETERKTLSVVLELLKMDYAKQQKKRGAFHQIISLFKNQTHNFDVEMWKKKYGYYNIEDSVIEYMYEKIEYRNSMGLDTTIDDVSLSYTNTSLYYRNMLYNEMIENGYDKNMAHSYCFPYKLQCQ